MAGRRSYSDEGICAGLWDTLEFRRPFGLRVECSMDQRYERNTTYRSRFVLFRRVKSLSSLEHEALLMSVRL